VSSNRSEGSLDIPSPIALAASGRVADDAALRQAVEDVFVRCQLRIGRYLAQMVRDRALAEDLLQDSFHDALRSRADLPAVRNPEAWLFGIARNRALAAMRRRRRFAAAVGRLAGRHQAAKDEDEELVAVRDLLERHLSAEDRALVLLRYLHDFDANELAEMAGLTPDAVRQRLSRARARLVAVTRLDTQGERR
jgi:RNA polymerase sigma-70 factor, ECF subfamily